MSEVQVVSGDESVAPNSEGAIVFRAALAITGRVTGGIAPKHQGVFPHFTVIAKDRESVKKCLSDSVDALFDSFEDS